LSPQHVKKLYSCTLFSHFASVLGNLIPQTLYRGFTPGPTGNYHSPRLDPLSQNLYSAIMPLGGCRGYTPCESPSTAKP